MAAGGDSLGVSSGEMVAITDNSASFDSINYRKEREKTFFSSISMATVQAVVAEWLRRLTRNQLGSPRAGSNPAHCVFFFLFFLLLFFFLLACTTEMYKLTNLFSGK